MKTRTNDQPLTAKEEKFCYEYCIDLNATKAAIRAGYSEKTARSIACRMLTYVNVQERIKKLKNNLSETAELTALKVLLEHKKIAFGSMDNLFDDWITRKDFEALTVEQKACISEIDTKIKTEYEYDPNEEKRVPIRVEYVRVKLYDKQKALDSIASILGYNAATHNILSGKFDYGKLSDEQLTQIAATILNSQAT